MVADIVLGVNSLSTSISGWDNPSAPFRQSLNQGVPRKRRKARSFGFARRQRAGADYLSVRKMYLLPGVIMVGQCLHFGFHVFNLLRRRELQDPFISAC
jgi:hypothetical protein